jgi:hypothetical protein
VLYWLLSWVGLCLVIVQLLDRPDEPGVTLMLYACLPLVAVLAYLSVSARRRQIEVTTLGELSGAEEVELKVRFMLEEYVELKRAQNLWNAVGDLSMSGNGGSGGIGGMGGMSGNEMSGMGPDGSSSDDSRRLVSLDERFAPVILRS